MTMHAALPGWYGDGSGTQRWWNGRGWTEFLDHEPPAALPARATLADSGDDVDVLPRYGIVAPATSLDHGPLRRGRPTARRAFPTFAVVSITCMTLVTGLGFWLLGQ
jgi:hypothetical protein